MLALSESRRVSIGDVVGPVGGDALGGALANALGDTVVPLHGPQKD